MEIIDAPLQVVTSTADGSFLPRCYSQKFTTARSLSSKCIL